MCTGKCSSLLVYLVTFWWCQLGSSQGDWTNKRAASTGNILSLKFLVLVVRLLVWASWCGGHIKDHYVDT